MSGTGEGTEVTSSVFLAPGGSQCPGTQAWVPARVRACFGTEIQASIKDRKCVQGSS